MHFFFLRYKVADLKKEKEKKEQTKYSMSINEESEPTINLVWLTFTKIWFTTNNEPPKMKYLNKRHALL